MFALIIELKQTFKSNLHNTVHEILSDYCVQNVSILGNIVQSQDDHMCIHAAVSKSQFVIQIWFICCTLPTVDKHLSASQQQCPMYFGIPYVFSVFISCLSHLPFALLCHLR